MEFVIAALLAAIATGVWVIIRRGPRAVHSVIVSIIDHLRAAAELKALADLVVTLEEDPTRIEKLGSWSREQYAAALSQRLQMVTDAMLAAQGSLARFKSSQADSAASYEGDIARAGAMLASLENERLCLQGELDALGEGTQA